MVKKPMKELTCAKCGLTIKQSGWTMHWKNVQKVCRPNARKVLVEGELPTKPQWLESNYKAPMVSDQVDEYSLNKFLPQILKCIETGEKIPWHFRDFTYKLLEANVIKKDQLKDGKPFSARNKVKQREKDNYQTKTYHPDSLFNKKNVCKFMKTVIPEPLEEIKIKGIVFTPIKFIPRVPKTANE